MRTWLRARASTRCRWCHNRIAEGDVILIVRPDGTSVDILRCQPCGEKLFGDPAPEVPELEPVALPQPSRRQGFVMLPDIRPHAIERFRDVRMRQTGENSE